MRTATTVPFARCFECNHRYATDEALVNEYREMAKDLELQVWTEVFGLPHIGKIAIPPAEAITFCPLCAADL